MKRTKLSLAGFAMIFMIFALPISMSIGFDKSAEVANQGTTEFSQFQTPSIDFAYNVAFAEEAAVDQPTAPEVAAPVENTGEVGGPEAGGVRDDGTPADPTWFDKVLAALAASGGLLAGLALIFEIVLRIFPSKKPLSVLIPVRYACVSLAAIFTLIGNFATTLINTAQNAEQKKS